MTFMHLQFTLLQKRPTVELTNMSRAPAFITRQDEESRIIRSCLRQLRDCMGEEQEILYRNALGRVGLSPEVIENTSLHFSEFDRILAQVRRRLPGITLKLFSSLPLIDLGLIGYAIASSHNLEKALQIANSYHSLTSDRFEQVFEIQGDTAFFRPLPYGDAKEELRDIAEDCLAGDWNLLCHLLSTQLDSHKASVHFAYPRPDHVDAYLETFQCPCHFDADCTELRFPSAWCELPVTSGNWYMADICQEMCAQLLQESPEKTPEKIPQENSTPPSEIVAAVKRLLITRPGRHFLRLEDAAQALERTPSQLRYQLYQAATHYKALVLEVRMTLARHYLQATNLSVQEVAYLLDYSQTAPFDRAFKKYFGMTPRQCRNKPSP